jgi:hypothetical protein
LIIVFGAAFIGFAAAAMGVTAFQGAVVWTEQEGVKPLSTVCSAIAAGACASTVPVR